MTWHLSACGSLQGDWPTGTYLVAVWLTLCLGSVLLWAGGMAQAETPQVPASSDATSSGIIVRAETLHFDRIAKRLTAVGAVEVVYGQTRLSADHVVFNTETGVGSARGQVHLVTPEEDIRGSQLDFALLTDHETLYHGSGILAQTYRVAGERLERRGAETFLVHEGRITTCSEALPDWEFRAREARVELGSAVTLKHPSLWIRGVPVFYLPYFIVPLREARTAGFLPPQLGYSERNGAEVLTQFYWPMTDWADATIGAEFFSQKGVMPEVEFRYAIDPLSDGQLEGAFIRELDTGETLWRVLLRQRQEFGWGLRALTQLDLRSDTDIERQFSRNLRAESAIRTASFGSLSKRFPDSTLSLGGESFEGIPESGFTDHFRRLPSVRFRQFPVSLWGAGFFAVDASYARLQDSEVLDDTPVQRLDIFPHLSVPLRFAPWGHLTIVGGVRETFYDHGATRDATLSRELFDVRAHLAGPTLWRRYPRAAGGGSLVHLMSWRLDYRYVPQVDQEHIPPFETLDAAQHFLDPLETFTLIDRIEAANYAKISFVQRVFAQRGGPGPASLQEVAYLIVSQGVNFDAAPETRQGMVGPLDIEFNLHFWQRWWLTSVVRLLPAHGDLQETNWRLGVTLVPGWDMHMGGRFRQDPDILQLSGGTRLTLRDGFWLQYDWRYDALLETFREHVASLLYENPCRCWRVQMSLRVRESGDTEFLMQARILP